jgi:RND family efflux transporter MFP subunit
MKRHQKVALITSLLPLLAWGQAGNAPNQTPAAPVTIETAQKDTFSATLWVSGTVISKSDARIAAETDGRVTWVAEVGSRIAKGDAIAEIDSTGLELELADSQAQLASLESQLNYQRNNLTRLEQLAASNNAAANQLDEAQAQLDMTVQSIKRANVSIKQIKRRIQQASVIAPFPGVVAERLIQVGEFVNRGAQVARLVDTGSREIRAQAPLSVAGWIREGMEVSVEHQQRSSLSPVSRVIPVGDERSRMFEVRIDAKDPAWIIGSPVRVALPNSEPRELVAIPRDALVLRGSDVFIMRVNIDNTVEKVNVETGIGLGGFVEVIGNVEQGDRIITRGGERLQSGQPVTISES